MHRRAGNTIDAKRVVVHQPHVAKIPSSVVVQIKRTKVGEVSIPRLDVVRKGGCDGESNADDERHETRGVEM